MGSGSASDQQITFELDGRTVEVPADAATLLEVLRDRLGVRSPKDGCSLSAEQVLRLLEGRIARYKHPKEVVFVGQLPKTALGKIRKDDVRRMVAHEAAA